MLFIRNHQKKDQVVLLPIERVQPNPAQPRTVFDDDELDMLAQSIKQNGLLQPVAVRVLPDGNYELISGERRLRACKRLEYREVKAIVLEVTDKQSAVFAMIENLQRADLSFFDEARGIYELIYQWDVTQEEAALKLGMAQSTIANKLRLLRLPREIQDTIKEYGLTERHARALLKLREEAQQREAVGIIIQKKLNVAQTDKLIESLLQQKKPAPKRLLIVKDLRIFVKTINHAVDTMKQAGINAEVAQSDDSDYIQYTVRIPKTSAYQHRANQNHTDTTLLKVSI